MWEYSQETSGTAFEGYTVTYRKRTVTLNVDSYCRFNYGGVGSFQVGTMSLIRTQGVKNEEYSNLSERHAVIKSQWLGQVSYF